MEPTHEPDIAVPLERSLSQLSVASSMRSTSRAYTLRAKSKSRAKLNSHVSSSASSITASDKSLTSFPSFSPDVPRSEASYDPNAVAEETSLSHRKPCKPARTASIVESLTSSDTQKVSRNALFEDAPLSTRKIPGALHLADAEHIERLVARHGAANLVRQVAEDLAQRDMQIANLRRKADERERALRKIILECGLSSLDLETKLRTVEAEIKAQDQAKRTKDGALSDLMTDAMQDTVTQARHAFGQFDDATIRASSLGGCKDKASKGTLRSWKDWLMGTGSVRRISSGTNSPDVDGKTPATKVAASADRGPAIQNLNLFSPPDAISVRSFSRASSIHSNHGPRTASASASLASMALKYVAGKANNGLDDGSTRGRSISAGQGGQGGQGGQNGRYLRALSTASSRTTYSNRATSSLAGPKALMAMRRPAPAPQTQIPRSQPHERWDSMDNTPPCPSSARPDNNGPVEMDTIFSPEGQPPTLTHIYNNHMGSEYLTDRFGFIYDQRRKKRQREAAQMARQIKHGSHTTEMLTGGRSGISPGSTEDSASFRSIRTTDSDDRPDTPNSEEMGEQAKPKRWQDYLKVATYPTELLSHTPSMTASGFQVLEGNNRGNDGKPVGTIQSDGRGFVPLASTTSAINHSEVEVKSDEEAVVATMVKEDAEPVKLLLQQLSDVHDALQREKTVRWNEFLRKVRAERKREGEAARASAMAAAQARSQQAPVMIPEAKLTDGEIVGVADLGVKGKVGRAKWNEFRTLVLGGIPVTNRAKIWSECSGATYMRVPGYYDDLVSRSSEADEATVVSQIEMDINRTLTDNIFFRKGPGVGKLSQVLRAYARRNPGVGYCQGMNLIAANLLLIMPSAEDAFWILTSMMEHILPEGYYDHSLMASRADQQVLRQYVSQVLPKLSRHLEELLIELEALTFQWFLSLFTDCLSAEALFRVWDVVLCSHDGSTFLFQVALALLKLNEQQLLQCRTSAAIYTYINHQMTNHAISIDGLIHASEGLRKLVKREDVEELRAKAIAAEKELMREREEQNQKRRSMKLNVAPALVVVGDGLSAGTSMQPSPVSVGEEGSTVSVKSSDVDEEGLKDTMGPSPSQEEAGLRFR